MTELPENLTPAQAAEYLQVDRRMIYELTAQHRIPSFKLGHRTLRIPREGLLKAIADGGIFKGPYGLGPIAAQTAAMKGGRVDAKSAYRC